MKPKLTSVAIPLILVAVFIDFILDPLIDLLTFGIGGLVVDFGAAFLFHHWLDRYQVQLYGPKNRAFSVATTVLEGLPEINILPMWTIRIVMLIMRDRATNGGV